MGDVVSVTNPRIFHSVPCDGGQQSSAAGKTRSGGSGRDGARVKPAAASARGGLGARRCWPPGGRRDRSQGPESGSGREIALVKAAEGSRHEGLSVSSQKARGARVNSSRRLGKGKAKAGSRHDGAGAAMRRARGSTAIETRDRGALGKARLRKSRGATVIGARACQLIVTLSHVGSAASAVDGTRHTVTLPPRP
jgi:hypothetical protein